MTNKLEIYPATKKDIPLIFNFLKQLTEYENLNHEMQATEESLGEALFGEKTYAEAIIGYLNQLPVSYAIFNYNFSSLLAKPGIYLLDLYVAPEFRAQGVGRSMLVYLAKLVKERKCGCLEWAVLNWNQPAITLYENIGAKGMREWTPYRLAGEALDNLASSGD
jgi:ribosomal protein S18 acetylase RimI-like enzyme